MSEWSASQAGDARHPQRLTLLPPANVGVGGVDKTDHGAFPERRGMNLPTNRRGVTNLLMMAIVHELDSRFRT